MSSGGENISAPTAGKEPTGEAPLRRNAVSLEDKYDLAKNRIFITGTQAIVRLLLMQKERDRRNGLNTAGFVTGYRGSPLGAVDMQLEAAAKYLRPEEVVFVPALNEDLGATAVWGTQQAEMRGEGRYDGVFGLWYGKGPGVDRSGDVFRHANLAGTSMHGGVIALMGDDHTAEILDHRASVRVSLCGRDDAGTASRRRAGNRRLRPAGLGAEPLRRGLGRHQTHQGHRRIHRLRRRVAGSYKACRAADFAMPESGLNIRPRDPVLTQEARLQDYKRDAIVAWVRANRLNRIVYSGGPNAKLGIITTGKPYLDVRQAFDDLGIDEKRANDLGFRLYKIGCPWPLESEGVRQFAEGLDL